MADDAQNQDEQDPQVPEQPAVENTQARTLGTGVPDASDPDAPAPADSDVADPVASRDAAEVPDQNAS